MLRLRPKLNCNTMTEARSRSDADLELPPFCTNPNGPNPVRCYEMLFTQAGCMVSGNWYPIGASPQVQDMYDQMTIA